MRAASPRPHGAFVSVTRAGIGFTKAQFLCHTAVRSGMNSHGVVCGSLERGTSQMWGQEKTKRSKAHFTSVSAGLLSE